MVDAQKIAFVLGEIPRGADPDDEDVRHRLVEERVRRERPTLAEDEVERAFVVRLYQLLADQIAEDDPPEVWQTARRLLDSGLAAGFVMSNLMLVFAAALAPSPEERSPFDDGYYLEGLGQLPLPPVDEMVSTFEDIFGPRGFVTADELIDATLASFGADDEPPAEAVGASTRYWVERALDELTETETSVLMLYPDLLVHVPTILSGATLTHRLTEAERSVGWIPTGSISPLSCAVPIRFSGRTDPRVEIEMVTDDAGILAGTPGWLEGFEPGSLIGFFLTAARRPADGAPTELVPQHPDRLRLLLGF